MPWPEFAEGEVEVAGQSFTEGRLLVFRPGDHITLRAKGNARVMLLGGRIQPVLLEVFDFGRRGHGNPSLDVPGGRSGKGLDATFYKA